VCINSNFELQILLMPTGSKAHIFCTAQTPGSWVRKAFKAWIYVSDFVLLSCVGTVLAMGRSSIQGVLPKCVEEFIVSEVGSNSEQAIGHNPWNVQASSCLQSYRIFEQPLLLEQ
jgi:hypothetical protein